MSLLFLKGGILTTIQDLGRRGFQRFGINPNGAMDTTAVRLVNILLGNPQSEAVLEMHFPAPAIRFEKPAIFALGGADFSAELNNSPIETNRGYFAESGDILRFKKKLYGNRAYLSVDGGFAIEPVLASASTNLLARFGGFKGRKIDSGERVNFKIPFTKHEFEKSNVKISNSLIPFYRKFPTVRVTAGAEFENLTALGEQNFLKTDFLISPESNRMGFRLAGEPVFLHDHQEIVSSAVDFGTIQLLPDGQMIILMADHQTTGGYPRLANIISTDLPLAAQLSANDKIAFELVSLAEAENRLLEFEKNLNILKTAVRFR